MVQSDSPAIPIFRYQQIARTLRTRVAQGDYPHDRLPSERQLMTEFGVQRDTIRRALESLIADGVLLRDSTRGTHIAPGFRQSANLNPAQGGVLLVVRTFADSTAPSAVFRGLALRLGEAGIPAYWHDPGDKTTAWSGVGPDQPLPSPEILHQRGIQGVVVWPLFPMNIAPLRILRESFPLVLIDRLVPGFETDFVGFQDDAGGRAATEHLLALGHRRIGFLSGEPQVSAVQKRLSGYMEALRAAGMEPDLDRLVYHQEGGSRCLTPLTVSHFLQADGDPLTAVVCANDLVAAHLIQFARAFGLRIPQDLAVTGFGDLMPAMMDAFGITTIAQPFEELGRTAADILLRRLRSSDNAPLPLEEIELPLRLIVRESSGLPTAV